MAIVQPDVGSERLIPTTYAQTLVPNFNIAAVGDWGCSADANSTVQNIVGTGPELVIGLGDYSYVNTADCWLEIVEPIDQKMRIVIGNHDDDTAGLLHQYMFHFGLLKDYYSFDHENMHFIVMSTESNYTVGSEQYNFVKDDLSKVAADPNIDWIVVSFHRLAYTSPGPHLPNVDLRDIYHPLFDAYDVDLVLQGHNHNYQRTYPIRYNNENSFFPIVSNTNSSNYDSLDGQIFVVVGTGGRSNYNLTEKDPYVAYQEDDSFGFLNVEVTDGGSTLRARYLDNSGTTKDEFMITKSTQPG